LSLENYHLYRLAVWLVTRLPRGVVYFVAGLIAEANFFVNHRSRKGVYANQRQVPSRLPNDLSVRARWWRWRMARHAFRSFAYSVADFFRIPQMTSANADRFIAEVRGWEHVEAAQAAGAGCIFITAHIGSWELAGAYLSLKRVPLTIVALPHKDRRVDQLFLGSRQASGMEVVPVGGAMRKLEDALRRGRFIGLIADRDVTGRGPVLSFFGRPTRVPNGHAALALRTGAWILPGCIYRRPDRELTLEIRPPIIPDPAQDTVEGLTLHCLGILEEFIRARPEQWSSFYDLWSETDLPVA